MNWERIVALFDGLALGTCGMPRSLLQLSFRVEHEADKSLSLWALVSTLLTSPSLREDREERAVRVIMVAVCSTSVRDCGAGPPLAVARPSRREGERDNVRFV